MTWEVEQIPDSAVLFYRVHATWFLAGEKCKPSAFKPPQDCPGEISMDWEKYCTKEDTQRRGRKPPEEYGVLSLEAGKVRDSHSVEHTPLDCNRAHSDIRGIFDAEARKRLTRLAETVIPVPAK